MRDFSIPGSGIRSPFGGPRWHPRALFSGGAAGALYLPSPATCCQDAAGTTPAGDGDPVGYLADLSGNGNHATQATSASRPTLVQDAGERWSSVGDGVDDILLSPSLDLSHTDTVTVVFALDRNAASGKLISSFGPSYNAAGSLYLTTENGITVEVGGPGYRIRGTGFYDPVPVLISAIIRRDGSVPETYVNGDLNTGNNAQGGYVTGNFGAYPFSLHDRDGVSIPSDVPIYAAMLIDRALTEAERTAAERYFANLSGVML